MTGNPPDSADAANTAGRVLMGCTAVAALGVVLFGLVFCHAISHDSWPERQAFDAAMWKSLSHDYAADDVRLSMIDDLVDSKRLEGMAREDVFDLLGGPAGDAEGTLFASYWVGHDPCFVGADSLWLEITFAANGRVNGVRVRTD